MAVGSELCSENRPPGWEVGLGWRGRAGRSSGSRAGARGLAEAGPAVEAGPSGRLGSRECPQRLKKLSSLLKTGSASARYTQKSVSEKLSSFPTLRL